MCVCVYGCSIEQRSTKRAAISRKLVALLNQRETNEVMKLKSHYERLRRNEMTKKGKWDSNRKCVVV